MNQEFSVRDLPPGINFIGFAGKKQTGKTTAAHIAAEILAREGYSIYITSFAEPLKRFCVEILGLDELKIYGSNAAKESKTHILWDSFPLNIRVKYSKVTREPRIGPMTVREVMQVFGTDIVRSIYDLAWAEAPFRKTYVEDIVILDDVRYPDEKACLEYHGGKVILLERDTGFKDEHISEHALGKCQFKYKYNNNGSLDDLKNFIKGFLC